jgi:F1F0 ATPase subunit 2
MNETVLLILALVAGFLLGAVFFGGLWWTVRKGSASRLPALWFVGSAILRVVVVLAGFYLVSGAHLDRLAASLLGFVIARFVILRLTRNEKKPEYLAGKVSHAP